MEKGDKGAGKDVQVRNGVFRSNTVSKLVSGGRKEVKGNKEKETTQQWVSRVFYSKLKKRRKLQCVPKRNQTLKVQLKKSDPNAVVVDAMGRIKGCCQVDLGNQYKCNMEHGGEVQSSSDREEEDSRVVLGKEACKKGDMEVDEDRVDVERGEVSFVSDAEVVGRAENMEMLSRLNRWVDRGVEECNEGACFVDSNKIVEVHRKRQNQRLRADDYLASTVENLRWIEVFGQKEFRKESIWPSVKRI